MNALAQYTYRPVDGIVGNTALRNASMPDSLAVSQDIGANLLTDFFAFLDVTEKTRETYRKALRQLFRYFTENGISRPQYDDILNFKKALEAAGRKPSTIALYLAAIRRFFAWTEQRGICPNIATGIKPPKQERGHKRDFLAGRQLAGMLSGMKRNSLQERRDYVIMLLMSVCGLRTVEVIRANVEDMRTLGECMVLFVQGKGRKDRTEFVKLPELVQKEITDYLALRGKVSDTDPLFASCSKRNKGGRLTTRTISGIAKATMREAGYNSTRLTAHSLRHSAVTLALMNGTSTQEVQAFARHSNINTTMIYSHAVDRLQSICENTICSAIFGRTE